MQMNFSIDLSEWQCKFYNWSDTIVKFYCNKYGYRIDDRKDCIVIKSNKKNIFITANCLKVLCKSKYYSPQKYYFARKCSLDNFEWILASHNIEQNAHVFEKAYVTNIKKNLPLISMLTTINTSQVVWGKNNKRPFYAIRSDNVWKHNNNLLPEIIQQINQPFFVSFLSVRNENKQYFMITTSGYLYKVCDDKLKDIIDICKWSSVYRIKRLYFITNNSWFVLCTNGMYYYKNIPEPVKCQLEQLKLPIEDINIGPNNEYFIQIVNSKIYIGYNFSEYLTWTVNYYLSRKWIIKNIHFGIQNEWYIELNLNG